ncbi:MAG: hypothetical protein Q9227_000606 [Pyrenula ochraceoflavens]
MSYSYDRIDRRRTASYGSTGRRTTLGYWIPLALTVTVATVGLAAWIWSERKDDDNEGGSEEEHYQGGIPPPGYASMSGGIPVEGNNPADFQGPPPPGTFGAPAPGLNGPPPPGAEYSRSTGAETQDENNLVARMSGALRRTPSPQQSYDWASKKVAAGVAAAGAMVGGALSSIREGSQEDFEDHERWSEEADNRDQGREPKQGIRRRGTADEFFGGKIDMPRHASLRGIRKSVAIVVSAVENDSDGLAEVGHHASILAHLPEHVNPDVARIFVLIYIPELKAHPLSTASTKTPASLTSSYSNIAHEDAHSLEDTEERLANVDPHPIDDTPPLFKTLYNQAQALVDKDSMIMPFTMPTGHMHILRSLGPETVYIQESLCGHDGDLVSSLSGWVKQTVVVVGDEGGHGGLVDTDDEAPTDEKHEKWWQQEERTGLGKRVAVVDSLRVGEDWGRRVNGHD